jgi:uncharacterized protein (TIGR03083 family)
VSVGAAFASAARAAADALALPVVADRWDAPSALTGMTVGALAAHLDAGNRRFEALLAAPEPTEGPALGIGAYYGINRIEGDATASDDPVHAWIRDDAAHQAEAGPVEVLATFSARIDRLLAIVPSMPAGRWLSCRVPGARARFDDYLATRVVELAVHTDDLLVSVGVPDRAPDSPVADVALAVAWELARARSGDLAVLRACFRGERAGPVLPVL